MLQNKDFGLFSGGGATCGGLGTVTNVQAIGCSFLGCIGIAVDGSPITTSGILCICNTAPYLGQAVEVVGGGTSSTYRCGVNNLADGNYSASLGGICNINTSTAPYSFIGGGQCNCSDSCLSTISGGYMNGITTNSCYATIAGGYKNTIYGSTGSFIGGGSNAITSSAYSFIGGGVNQINNSVYSGISSGLINKVCNNFSFIGGGCCSTITGAFSSISGGYKNVVSSNYSAILGGCCNTINGAYSGAFGCGIIGSCACTFYTNNHCTCGSFYTSSIASGCAVCVNGSGGQLVGFTIPTTSNYGLFSQTGTSTPITTTTTEGTLIDGGVGTLSVPANGFRVGDSFFVTMGGFMSAKNNDNITIRTKTGSVILADSGALSLPAITNQVWTLTITFTIRAIGGAGVASIVTTGQYHILKLASGTQEGYGFNTINNTTFNTTIPNTLDITAQWSSNSALNSISSNSFVLNKLY